MHPANDTPIAHLTTLVSIYQNETPLKAKLILQESLLTTTTPFYTYALLMTSYLKCHEKIHALNLFKEIEKIDPSNIQPHTESLFILTECANTFLVHQHFSIALFFYNKLLTLHPNHITSWLKRGEILRSLGLFEEALNNYNHILLQNPENEIIWFNRANILCDLQQYQEALLDYKKVLTLNQNETDALIYQGHIYTILNKPQLAIACYQDALSQNPNHLSTLTHLAELYDKEKQWENALNYYYRTLTLTPNNASMHFKISKVLENLNQLEDALFYIKKANTLEQDNFSFTLHWGNILFKNQQFEKAIEIYKKINDHPSFDYRILINIGHAFLALSNYLAAKENFQTAISLNPEDKESWFLQGKACFALKEYQRALESYNRSLEIDPNQINVLIHRGDLCMQSFEHAHAILDYERALYLGANDPFLQGRWLHCKMYLCDWSQFDAACYQLKQNIQEGKLSCSPFIALTLFDDPLFQKKCAELFYQIVCPSLDFSLAPKWPYQQHKKIRVAYFSADFHNHATTYLMAELFESHDHTQFEWFGFSFGKPIEDEMRTRIQKGFDHFIDVSSYSDEEIVQLVREFEVDIAIDLKGYTGEARTNIFAYRCAPIQINYLGYPGTMSAPYIDYMIADHTLIPTENQKFYSEKIAYLPHSYQANDQHRTTPSNTPSKKECGLPEDQFIFCCFNSVYKILPEIFSIWMRLLDRIPQSVLWLLEENHAAVNNLRNMAKLHQIDPKRLIFAKRTSFEEHLSKHRLADLFLDTWPCNAHTTASDALWMELPLITLQGQSFASRVAASLLNTLDLPELITYTPKEYEALAYQLATEPDALSTIKRKLISHKTSAPLFNGKQFAKEIEILYQQMMLRYQQQLPPDTLTPIHL